MGRGGGGVGRATGGRHHPFIPPSEGTRVHTHTPTHPHPRRLDPRGRAARLRLRPRHHLEKSSRTGPLTPRAPLWGGDSGASRAQGRPAKPPGALGAEPAASPPRRPGARPEIAGLPTSKRRPAHQSARAAGPPRPPHSPLIRWRTPRRDLAGAAGRSPARVPRWTRRGSPGPPPGPPGHGEHGESRGGGGGGAQKTTIPRREQAPRRRGGERAPRCPFYAKDPSGPPPPPRPLRPPPGRLSTQVLFPAVTRRTKCPPGASNKNCAVDLTVHFKGASRAHGPGREVREPHPGQPSALLRPSGGHAACTPLLSSTCTLPPPPVAPYPAASSPRPRRAFLEAVAPGQSLRPHLLQQSSPLGRRSPRPPGGPGIHRDRGLIFISRFSGRY